MDFAGQTIAENFSLLVEVDLPALPGVNIKGMDFAGQTIIENFSLLVEVDLPVLQGVSTKEMDFARIIIKKLF